MNVTASMRLTTTNTAKHATAATVALKRVLVAVLLAACTALAAAGVLAATPSAAHAATLATDQVSFISINAVDATTADPAEGTGTLDNPYVGAVTTSATDEELVYLSVKFTDAYENGVATYLVQSATPPTTAAINGPMTNVAGRCNSNEPIVTAPGTYTVWVQAKPNPESQAGTIFKI